MRHCLGYALSVNIARRHLSKGQWAMIAAKARCIETIQAPVRTVAQDAGVSHGLISHAAVVLEYAPELAEAVIAGGSLDQAYAAAQRRKAQRQAEEEREARDLAALREVQQAWCDPVGAAPTSWVDNYACRV